jgi:hypothetical protein
MTRRGVHLFRREQERRYLAQQKRAERAARKQQKRAVRRDRPSEPVEQKELQPCR